MSSRRPDAPPPPASTGGEEGAPAPATKWPRWRISMLVGALVLLAAAIGDAAIEDLPRAVYVIVFFTGYVFLSYGFFLAMSLRNKAKRRD